MFFRSLLTSGLRSSHEWMSRVGIGEVRRWHQHNADVRWQQRRQAEVGAEPSARDPGLSHADAVVRVGDRARNRLDSGDLQSASSLLISNSFILESNVNAVRSVEVICLCWPKVLPRVLNVWVPLENVISSFSVVQDKLAFWERYSTADLFICCL